jgi:16S rRNA (cytidine1402-2'-O)-methyltransferase
MSADADDRSAVHPHAVHPNVGSNVELAPGLYVVATPIGNLEDITLRAVRVLRSADIIACEDTRHVQKLLNHYGIRTRTISYHEHNEVERAAELMKDLQKGARIALVSDAGMPGISDPGYRVVSLAVARGITVIPIPGPVALVAALAASGLPTDSFRFGGFLPAKSGQRRSVLESIANSPCTEIFYEAPHRIVATLEDVVATLGPDRPVVVAREVTKLHEEFLRGRAVDVFERLKKRGEVKGEITLLIAKTEATSKAATTSAPASSKAVRQRLEQMMANDKLDEKSALKKLARETGVSKSQLYRELQRSDK